MLQISADDLLHGPILTHLRKGVRQLLRKTAVIVDGKGRADSGDQQRFLQNTEVRAVIRIYCKMVVSWAAMAST